MLHNSFTAAWHSFFTSQTTGGIMLPHLVFWWWWWRVGVELRSGDVEDPVRTSCAPTSTRQLFKVTSQASTGPSPQGLKKGVCVCVLPGMKSESLWDISNNLVFINSLPSVNLMMTLKVLNSAVSPMHTHIHTSFTALRSSLRFSVLPKDTSPHEGTSNLLLSGQPTPPIEPSVYEVLMCFLIMIHIVVKLRTWFIFSVR